MLKSKILIIFYIIIIFISIKLFTVSKKNMANQGFFNEQEGAPYDYMFKLVLIGDSEVGKSQLLLWYTKD